MENNFIFSCAEDSVRKKWLFWAVKIPAFLVGIFLLVAFLGLSLEFEASAFSAILGYGVLTAGSLYVSYYCAYKKPGTILLFLYLIFLAIGLIGSVFDLSKLLLIALRHSTSVERDAALMVIVFLSVAFELRLFYLSYKLRKVNKGAQQRILESSEEYSHAASTFLLAANVQELKEKFDDLIVKYESLVARDRIIKAYNARNKILKEA